MQEALEKISRKLISADDASDSSRYICPECYMPVDLRAGSVRSAYFAHAHGVSNEDCKLYAAGQMNGGGYATHTQGDEEEQFLHLFLKIGRVRGQYTWGLELSVPTARQTYGSVTVDVGGLVSEINLAGNNALHRIVTVEPQSGPYKITEVTPKFGPLWSVHRECLGLSSEFATVFGDISVLGGKSYPLATQLRAERSFAFIWNAEIAPEFPEELTVKPLAARPGWAGAIVDIPHSPSQLCQDWLVHFSNLLFASTTPAILPVWPPLVRTVTSRLLEAQPNRTLMLFVEHPTSDVPPLFARCSTSERVAQAELCTAPFYILAPENAPSVYLACRKTEGLEIDIEFALNEGDLRPSIGNSVVLRGITNDGVKTSVALHNGQATAWLSSVRCGEIKFKGVEFPVGLTGFIRATRDFVAVGQVEVGGEFVSRIEEDSHVLTDAEKASKLAGWLLDNRLDVLIDFGGFGRSTILGLPEPEKNRKLEPETIKKVERYFIRFPNSARLKNNWRILSITELSLELKKIKTKKESIIFHRLLVSQLMRKCD